MNLPYLALYLVREFSRPVTRPDWRTCKRTEAKIIKESILQTQIRVLAQLGIYATTNPFQKERYREITRDVKTWTHYGRSMILKQPPGWLRRYLPPENYYVNRYWFMMP